MLATISSDSGCRYQTGLDGRLATISSEAGWLYEWKGAATFSAKKKPIPPSPFVCVGAGAPPDEAAVDESSRSGVLDLVCGDLPGSADLVLPLGGVLAPVM